MYRYLFLNQAKFRTTWNVTEKIEKGETKLEWSTIPADIKTLITDEKNTFSFLQLTFLDWGWVNANTDLFYNVTLMSLLPADVQAIIPNAKTIIDTVSFDTLVNISALKLSIYKPKKFGFPLGHSAEKHLDEFVVQLGPEQVFKSFNNGQMRFKRHKSFPPMPNPFDVIKRAVMSAYQVLIKAAIPFRTF